MADCQSRFIELFGVYPSNPKGWETATIRDIVADVRYGSSRPAVDGGKYPYLRMNNITYGGELDLTDTKRIDIPDNELDKCTVRRGDVLFNRTNSKELVGKTCVYNRDEMMVLAKEKNLILAEAMTIWHMPIYKELWKIVQSGELGKMQIMTVNFGSFKEYDMNNRFFNMNLAGGALLDIGVYALSAVRSFMSKQPNEIVSQVRFAPTGSDEQATILLKNEDQQMATIALSMHSKQPKRIMISLEKGYIEVYEFPRGQKATIVDAVTGKQTVIEKGNTENALYYEMCDMEEAVRNQDDSHLNLEYTKDVMDIMSQLRKEWKMQYPGEKW